MNEQRTASFPGRFASLAEIGEFVTQAAAEAGLDAGAVYGVQLAVDEACTNIIEHAYGGEGRGDITCTCVINSAGLTIVLRDHGRPFDPASTQEPNLHTNLENREVGGLGVYFIYTLMDEVHFEFTPDAGNVLTMVKHT